MAQQIVTEAYKVGDNINSITPHEGGDLETILGSGFRVIHTSSTSIPDLRIVYVTYVLEKPDGPITRTPSSK